MSGPTLVMLAAGMAKRYGGCKPLAPLGVHGEAIIDLTASDALRSGILPHRSGCRAEYRPRP